MQRPDTADARRQIVEILGNSVYHALGLKETLEDERNALEAQDMEKLQAALETKGRCVGQLRDMEQERQALCASAGFETGPEQMSHMIAWCDEGAVVENCWVHLMEIAAECLSINDTNGAIIHGRKQQIEAGMAIIRGSSTAQDVYDFRGRESRESNVRPIAQA